MASINFILIKLFLKKKIMSSKFNGGAPTSQETQLFGQQIEKATQFPELVLNPIFYDRPQNTPQENREITRKLNASNFPVRPLPKDSYDTTYKIKDDLTNPAVRFHDYDPNNQAQVDMAARAMLARPVPYTEADIDYIKRKRDDEEYSGYLTWQANKYDLNDPAERQWFNKVCPDYFKQRETLIDQQIDLSAQYTKLRLFGPRTEEDLKLEYFIETGRVKLPKGPIWDPYQQLLNDNLVPENATVQQAGLLVTAGQRAKYRRGLFSPMNPVTMETGGLALNRYNRSDIAGEPLSNYTGPYGSVQSAQPNYGAAYFGRNGFASNRAAINAAQPAIAAQNNMRTMQAAVNAVFIPNI